MIPKEHRVGKSRGWGTEEVKNSPNLMACAYGRWRPTRHQRSTNPGNRILIDFILAPQPSTTLHPEPVEGLSRLGVARGDEMDKNGPTLAYHVYMLRCSDGPCYVGHTNDLEHRLAAHERGAIEGYTLSRRPVELVFSDQFSTRLEAFHQERRIKGWSRARKEALIKGDWDELVELSNRSSGQGHPSTGSDDGKGL